MKQTLKDKNMEALFFQLLIDKKSYGHAIFFETLLGISATVYKKIHFESMISIIKRGTQSFVLYNESTRIYALHIMQKKILEKDKFQRLIIEMTCLIN